MFEEIVAIAALISWLGLLIFFSDKAVEHSVSIASALEISLFMFGLPIVSVYTDVSEKLYLRSAERKNTHREGDLKRG